MMKVSSYFQNSAQEKQDAIFRKMSDDEKLQLWAGLWLLAKELIGAIHYGKNRYIENILKKKLSS